MSMLYHHSIIRNIIKEKIYFFDKAEFYFWSDFNHKVRLLITLHSNKYGYNKVEARELKRDFEKELNLRECVEIKDNLLTKQCKMRYDLTEEEATTLYGYLNLYK